MFRDWPIFVAAFFIATAASADNEQWLDILPALKGRDSKCKTY
jgi:hypothetical protein